MQSGNQQMAAQQRVNTAQVYDIVSEEDMFPFLKGKQLYPKGHMIQLPRLTPPKVYADLLPLLFERTDKGWKRVQ